MTAAVTSKPVTVVVDHDGEFFIRLDVGGTLTRLDGDEAVELASLLVRCSAEHVAVSKHRGLGRWSRRELAQEVRALRDTMLGRHGPDGPEVSAAAAAAFARAQEEDT